MHTCMLMSLDMIVYSLLTILCFLFNQHLAKSVILVLTSTLFWYPRNVTLTISFIKKYLVQKLELDREDEVS